MVNVYMNPEKLEGRIAGLEDFAQSAIESRATIHCMYANDPIKSGESLGSLELAVVNAANAIKSHAEELRKCKTTMVNLNSNGVANHDLEGGVSIEVPDDSAGLETADKFGKWAQGATDANDLRSGKSKLPSGRSIDEVRESMKTNKGDTTYANSFIDRIGPENLAKLGRSNPAYNREAPIFGEILATASQTWGEEKSKKNAKLIMGSVDDESEWERIPVLNRIIGIGAHDADKDGVNDLKFGSNFLVFMGREAENLPQQKINEKFNRRDHLGNYRYGDPAYCDPLKAVLEAMGANEEAARGFLAPDGGSDKDVERVANLIKRYPASKEQGFPNSWWDAWARISAASAEAHGTDPVDSTGKGTSESRQAAAIAAGVVNTFGESEGRPPISSRADRNLASVLKIYAWSVDQAAKTGNPNGVVPSLGSYVEDDVTYGGQDKASIGLTYQPKFHADKLGRVLGDISRNEEDFSSVTRSVGELNANRMAYATSQAAKGDTSALRFATQSTSAARGYLIGAGHAYIEKDAADKDARNQAIIDTVMGLTAFAPKLPETAKFFEESSYSYAQNRGSDEIKNALENGFTNNLNTAIKNNTTFNADAGKRSQIDLLCAFASGGAITEKEGNFDTFKQRVPSYSGDGEDISADDIEQYANVLENPTGVLGDGYQSIFTDAKNSYQEGYNITHKITPDPNE